MLSSRRGDMSRCTGTGWGSRLPTVIGTSTAGTDQEISGSLVNSRKLAIDCKADCEECSLYIYILHVLFRCESDITTASRLQEGAGYTFLRAPSKVYRFQSIEASLNYGSCCVYLCASISVSKAVCIKIVTFCDINLCSIKLPITNTTH